MYPAGRVWPIREVTIRACKPPHGKMRRPVAHKATNLFPREVQLRGERSAIHITHTSSSPTITSSSTYRRVRPHKVNLSLTFHDNKTGHQDIVLRFAGEEWICDSYYFAIDSELLPEAEDDRKIRAVLVRLHEQWLEAVQELKADEVAYLPFDFSDQCTGWLRCTATSTGYSVVQGWSSVEGWSFSPSAVGGLLRKLEDFRASGPALEVATNDLLAAICGSASRAA